MLETAPCPYCGRQPGETGAGFDSLTSEIQRIRELVEAGQARADKQRIEDLSREVRQLRETVARLRGSAASVHGYR
jgi:hypothetical protein